MISVYVMRLFFVLISTFVGYQLGALLLVYGPHWLWIGAVIGCLVSCVIILAETALRNVSVRGLSAAVFGLLFGLIMSKLVIGAFLLVPLDENLTVSLQLILPLIFCYFGMSLAIRGRD